MAKYFFPSSFLLFLGNWIGQIALNWYVYDSYHNAFYLGLVNFVRLIPILFLSIWAGAIADKYDRGVLIRITITSSAVLTAILCFLSFEIGELPIYIILIYACGRGILNAVETPIRQAILPDLSEKLSTVKAVSYHSFIINICRSIGPAVAGGIIAVLNVKFAFLAQAVVYVGAALLCVPLHFKTASASTEEADARFSVSVVKDYFKTHVQGLNIFITSLLIMATGFSYTTLLPVLTSLNFPGQASVFGIAMTFSALGGITATLLLPQLLKLFYSINVYYLSSILFGITLLMVIMPNSILLFGCIFLIGLFSQCARTTNRVYFQTHIEPEKRGRILSIVMMDRGMIPLGAVIMSALTEMIGIVPTFITMGISTIVIATLFYGVKELKNRGSVI
ncbi:MFS transporter [Staphylococcus simulans]|uniref:MFS transporter n=1 Tax=Staphylococcus simulans TaxID=1286 RepID=UPI003F7EC638